MDFRTRGLKEDDSSSVNLCRAMLSPAYGPRPCYVRPHQAQRHLTSAQSHRVLRAAAMTTWREAVAAA
jgi:hypothetical protein